MLTKIASLYFQDRKDLQDSKLSTKELPHHINHQPSAIHQQHRHSQFWQKLITGGFFIAATTLFLLTTLPDQSQSQSQSHCHRNGHPYSPSELLPPLTFSPGDGKSNNQTFQISIFQDPHFGENAREESADASTIRVMNSVLDFEDETDLVVLSGDSISGSAAANSATAYLDQIVEPMVRRGLTWASTYGGNSSLSTREALFEREKVWLSSRTRRMAQGEGVGVTNYYLPVYPAGCQNRNRNQQQHLK